MKKLFTTTNERAKQRKEQSKDAIQEPIKKRIQKQMKNPIIKNNTALLDGEVNNCVIEKIKDKLTFLQYEISQLHNSLFYSGFDVSCHA
jgi:hypothetical protein